jgi:hypothetical protein
MALGFYKHTQYKERDTKRKRESKREKLKVFLNNKYGMI